MNSFLFKMLNEKCKHAKILSRMDKEETYYHIYNVKAWRSNWLYTTNKKLKTVAIRCMPKIYSKKLEQAALK